MKKLFCDCCKQELKGKYYVLEPSGIVAVEYDTNIGFKDYCHFLSREYDLCEKCFDKLLIKIPYNLQGKE